MQAVLFLHCVEQCFSSAGIMSSVKRMRTSQTGGCNSTHIGSVSGEFEGCTMSE